MSSDPYSQAFESAKAEIQKAKDDSETAKDAMRAKWQTESEADSAVLKDVVQTELHRASDALKKSGGRIETGGTVHADRNNAPASIWFRILDSGDWGRTSWFYDIRPQQGSVTITRANTVDMMNNQRKYEDVSEKFNIKMRNDLTQQSIQQLILAAIEEYRAARPHKL